MIKLQGLIFALYCDSGPLMLDKWRILGITLARSAVMLLTRLLIGISIPTYSHHNRKLMELLIGELRDIAGLRIYLSILCLVPELATVQVGIFSNFLCKIDIFN